MSEYPTESKHIKEDLCELCKKNTLYSFEHKYEDVRLNGKIFCLSCKKCYICLNNAQISTPDNLCNFCYCTKCGKWNGKSILSLMELSNSNENRKGFEPISYCFGEHND